LGFVMLSSLMRVPWPPARITTFMRTNLRVLKLCPSARSCRPRGDHFDLHLGRAGSGRSALLRVSRR
jgi:hypothetical protein